LFCFGYGYMGTMSLLQTAGGRRLTSVWRRSGAVARPWSQPLELSQT